MNRKDLPAEFDPKGYAASYPDVAASGLDPAAHFRLFGKALGRNPAGLSQTKDVSTKKPVAPAPTKEVAAPRTPALIARPQSLQLYPAGEATKRLGVDELGWIDFNHLADDGGLLTAYQNAVANAGFADLNGLGGRRG